MLDELVCGLAPLSCTVVSYLVRTSAWRVQSGAEPECFG